LKSVRAHVLLSGRVQGVGLRFRAANMAKSLKLGGWVRNLESGELEAVFDGPDEDVKKMLEWLKQGHGEAEIADMNVMKEEYIEGLKDFRIL
jgi:acylphosphatase